MSLPTSNPIDRINALTTNARNTWFALLAVLVFVGITLMSVEHIDFYGVDRATTLPLVNVDVPTRYFFVAAPILTAAIFGYFHLYLIRLWDAVARAPENIGGQPVGEIVSPWLITDAAFYMRTILRKDGSAHHRLLEGTAMALNILLAWGFGLLVLFFLWWLSMPARTFWMTAIAAASLFAASFVGATSFALMLTRMRDGPRENAGHVFTSLPAMISLIVAIPFLTALSYQRTEGSPENLAPLRMIDTAIVERPAGWKPYALAKTDFYATWCKREDETCKIAELPPERKRIFDEEWKARRAIQLADLRKPNWHQLDASKPNLRWAFLNGSFIAGADLRRAKMEGAVLENANLENANLEDALLEGSNLAGTELQFANLRGLHLPRTFMQNAKLDFANLQDSNFEGSNLRRARMEGAVLRGANLAGAQLHFVQFSNADLFRTVLNQAKLPGSFLSNTNLTQSYLNGSDISKADIFSSDFDDAKMDGANLNESKIRHTTFKGAQMQNSELFRTSVTNTNFDDANLVGSNFRLSKITEATFKSATMSWTDLSSAELAEIDAQGANLGRADFRRTQIRKSNLRANLKDATFWRANLKEVSFRGSNLEDFFFEEATARNSDFSWARMAGAKMSRSTLFGSMFYRSQLNGATLDFAFVSGLPVKSIDFGKARLQAATSHGGAFRNSDLSEVEFDRQTDFRNTFVDASAQVTPEFRMQMGEGEEGGPCQWHKGPDPLTDEAFYGHWRGWLEHPTNPGSPPWRWLAPSGFEDVTPIPPPDGCEWKTGPMPTP